MSSEDVSSKMDEKEAAWLACTSGTILNAPLWDGSNYWQSPAGPPPEKAKKTKTPLEWLEARIDEVRVPVSEFGAL